VIDAKAWLGSRTPPPPAELAGRIARVAEGREFADAESMSRFLVSEATAVLATLGNERSSANDLLLADALITYAMELVAGDPESVAAHAMRVISAVADSGGKP
jgi:hypothetical protein